MLPSSTSGAGTPSAFSPVMITATKAPKAGDIQFATPTSDGKIVVTLFDDQGNEAIRKTYNVSVGGKSLDRETIGEIQGIIEKMIRNTIQERTGKKEPKNWSAKDITQALKDVTKIKTSLPEALSTAGKTDVAAKVVFNETIRHWYSFWKTSSEEKETQTPLNPAETMKLAFITQFYSKVQDLGTEQNASQFANGMKELGEQFTDTQHICSKSSYNKLKKQCTEFEANLSADQKKAIIETMNKLGPTLNPPQSFSFSSPAIGITPPGTLPPSQPQSQTLPSTASAQLSMAGMPAPLPGTLTSFTTQQQVQPPLTNVSQQQPASVVMSSMGSTATLQPQSLVQPLMQFGQPQSPEPPSLSPPSPIPEAPPVIANVSIPQTLSRKDTNPFHGQSPIMVLKDAQRRCNQAKLDGTTKEDLELANQKKYKDAEKEFNKKINDFEEQQKRAGAIINSSSSMAQKMGKDIASARVLKEKQETIDTLKKFNTQIGEQLRYYNGVKEKIDEYVKISELAVGNKGDGTKLIIDEGERQEATRMRQEALDLQNKNLEQIKRLEKARIECQSKLKELQPKKPATSPKLFTGGRAATQSNKTSIEELQERFSEASKTILRPSSAQATRSGRSLESSRLGANDQELHLHKRGLRHVETQVKTDDTLDNPVPTKENSASNTSATTTNPATTSTTQQQQQMQTDETSPSRAASTPLDGGIAKEALTSRKRPDSTGATGHEKTLEASTGDLMAAIRNARGSPQSRGPSSSLPTGVSKTDTRTPLGDPVLDRVAAKLQARETPQKQAAELLKKFKEVDPSDEFSEEEFSKAIQDISTEDMANVKTALSTNKDLPSQNLLARLNKLPTATPIAHPIPQRRSSIVSGSLSRSTTPPSSLFPSSSSSPVILPSTPESPSSRAALKEEQEQSKAALREFEEPLPPDDEKLTLGLSKAMKKTRENENRSDDEFFDSDQAMTTISDIFSNLENSQGKADLNIENIVKNAQKAFAESFEYGSKAVKEQQESITKQFNLVLDKLKELSKKETLSQDDKSNIDKLLYCSNTWVTFVDDQGTDDALIQQHFNLTKDVLDEMIDLPPSDTGIKAVKSQKPSPTVTAARLPTLDQQFVKEALDGGVEDQGTQNLLDNM